MTIFGVDWECDKIFMGLLGVSAMLFALDNIREIYKARKLLKS